MVRGLSSLERILLKNTDFVICIPMQSDDTYNLIILEQTLSLKVRIYRPLML